ncbi:MAG: NAD(+) synthase, partial [Oscillospiraceae bacterium]
YCYADSGMGESTTDMVFAGHRLICENGAKLAESSLFTLGLTMADVDVERLAQDRRKMNTWHSADDEDVYFVEFSYSEKTIEKFQLRRSISPTPFVPGGEAIFDRCAAIVRMQAAGLTTRLSHIGAKTAVLALSGGLDSTLALLITAEAFRILGLPNSGIKTVSMPCFGTTGRTKNNAESLARKLGVNFREISIEKSVRQHFADIGHDISVTDVTYENSQARERTQVVMDIANQEGGIVIGTGDLSELALGWATYNGDHMSMYGVNASVPKTLVRHLVRYFADQFEGEIGAILLDILDTPVSPELLPPRDGEISQKTEALVGPYELHDFFLYYLLRFGFAPNKIYHMACIAFKEQYEEEEIKKWLRVFYKRFFSQQFKRSCLPDGPKVGSVTLSPRGDFRMPSDACANAWLQVIDHL